MSTSVLNSVVEELKDAEDPFGAPVAVQKSADRFFVWSVPDIVKLRVQGHLAVSPIGACPTKTATRGKAAAAPALLSDEELYIGSSCGWLHVTEAGSGAEVDIASHMLSLLTSQSHSKRSLRCAVARDLWSSGYRLTNGLKFGCDFLAYRADPSMVHAAFMVIVVPAHEGIAPLDLVARSRVASAALKTCVIAWVDAAAAASAARAVLAPRSASAASAAAAAATAASAPAPTVPVVTYAAFRRMGPGTAIFADSEGAAAAEASQAHGVGGGSGYGSSGGAGDAGVGGWQETALPPELQQQQGQVAAAEGGGGGAEGTGSAVISHGQHVMKQQ